MEILKFLLDFFTKNQESPLIKNIFSILEKNSFDIKKVIENFSLDQVLPIIEGVFSQNKKPDEKPFSFSSDIVKNNPISEFCDAEIMHALNSYIGV